LEKISFSRKNELLKSVFLKNIIIIITPFKFLKNLTKHIFKNSKTSKKPNSVKKSTFLSQFPSKNAIFPSKPLKKRQNYYKKRTDLRGTPLERVSKTVFRAQKAEFPTKFPAFQCFFRVFRAFLAYFGEFEADFSGFLRDFAQISAEFRRILPQKSDFGACFFFYYYYFKIRF
jgi:hypothetical protein